MTIFLKFHQHQLLHRNAIRHEIWNEIVLILQPNNSAFNRRQVCAEPRKRRLFQCGRSLRVRNRDLGAPSDLIPDQIWRSSRTVSGFPSLPITEHVFAHFTRNGRRQIRLFSLSLSLSYRSRFFVEQRAVSTRQIKNKRTNRKERTDRFTWPSWNQLKSD